MKEIQLSQRGKYRGKYVALVDDEDFDALNQFRWSVLKSGKTFYAMRQITVGGKRTAILMHCVIMGGKGVDHRDGEGCNNTHSNLRFCTPRQNMMNRRKQENTSSVYKGVYFYKQTNKWRAQIKIYGKEISLGYFVLEVDAARARNQKEIELFGPFANLNIIL